MDLLDGALTEYADVDWMLDGFPRLLFIRLRRKFHTLEIGRHIFVHCPNVCARVCVCACVRVTSFLGRCSRSRSLEQAALLDARHRIDFVVHIDVPFDVIVQRLQVCYSSCAVQTKSKALTVREARAVFAATCVDLTCDVCFTATSI